jgi:hypothetical protein
MVTITEVVRDASSDDARLRHGYVLDLVDEAAHLRTRPGVAPVLDLVGTAAEHDALTPEAAFSLAQQLRLVAGSGPADDDHLLLEALLAELVEYTSLVDGVHLDDLAPLVDHLVGAGDLAEAQRIAFLADAARTRVGILERPLGADLGAA